MTDANDSFSVSWQLSCTPGMAQAQEQLETKQVMILYTVVQDLTPMKVKGEIGTGNLVCQPKDREKHP